MTARGGQDHENKEKKQRNKETEGKGRQKERRRRKFISDLLRLVTSTYSFEEGA